MINTTPIATVHDVAILKRGEQVVLFNRYSRHEVALSPDEARAMSAALADAAGPAPEKKGARK